MREHPNAVTEITQVLMVDAGCFTVGGLVAFPLVLLVWDTTDRILPLILTMLALVIGALYAFLAFEFHALKPWAYKLVYYLVRIDRLSLLMRLSEKIEMPEVRHAFDLNQGSNSTKAGKSNGNSE